MMPVMEVMMPMIMGKLMPMMMTEENMDFRDANKLGWTFIYKERGKPCVLSNETPTGKGEQIDEQIDDETLDQMEKDEEAADAAPEPTSVEEKQIEEK